MLLAVGYPPTPPTSDSKNDVIKTPLYAHCNIEVTPITEELVSTLSRQVQQALFEY